MGAAETVTDLRPRQTLATAGVHNAPKNPLRYLDIVSAIGQIYNAKLDVEVQPFNLAHLGNEPIYVVVIVQVGGRG